MNKGGLIVEKKEMTKIWVDDNFFPVTLVKVLPQEIIRYKNMEKDGYTAAVIWVGDKQKKKTKSWKEQFDYPFVIEMKVTDDFVKNHEVGSVLDSALFEGVEAVEVIGKSKWKGFQWVIKRHNLSGMPDSHGHKYKRVWGSKGNRKPRRWFKWHPHAGHMGDERITLKKVPILDVVAGEDEQLLALKWSLPGHYNGLLRLLIS